MPVIARGLPPAEISAGLLLAVGVVVRLVAPVIGLLLVVFAAAMVVNLARGHMIDCGCAGSASQRVTWRHVALNLALAALATVVALEAPTAVWSWAEWADIVPALMTLVAAAAASALVGHGWRALRAAQR